MYSSTHLEHCDDGRMQHTNIKTGRMAIVLEDGVTVVFGYNIGGRQGFMAAYSKPSKTYHNPNKANNAAQKWPQD